MTEPTAPDDLTISTFAGELRMLRLRAGRPSFRELQKATGYGRTVLSQAFNGNRLPTWEVVRAVVTALDGDQAGWRLRWASLAEHPERGDSPAPRPAQRLPRVPRQLPAAIPHFVGRRAELDRVTSLANRAGGQGGPAGGQVICVVGTAGVGKTTLVIHWARQHADRFPDGQLYVNLQGFEPDGEPVDPSAVLHRFLDALQVPAGRIPTDRQARIDLFRTLTDDRRLLVVLDNARSTDQIRPLLPGGSGCTVLVTSRQDLPALVVHSQATLLRLELFSMAEARELLGALMGGERMRSDPVAVDRLIEQCDRLPLAVALLAARVAVDPTRSYGALAGELRAEADRLAALSDQDSVSTDLRAVFSVSYRTLSAVSARVFRLVALHPGARFGVAALASMAAIDPGGLSAALTEITRANLLTQHTEDRYRCHALLRAYAADRLRAEESAPDREAATRRMLGHYLWTALRAALLLNPTRSPIDLGAPPAGVDTEDLVDHDRALAWFDEEYPVLCGLVTHLDGIGDDRVWQLVWTLADYQDRVGHWPDMIDHHRIALAAATRAGSHDALIRTHGGLGRVHLRTGEHAAAFDHFVETLRLAEQTGDEAGQARAHRAIAQAHEFAGHYGPALDHARCALRLADDRDNHGRASALNAIGWYHAKLGDYQPALRHCRLALKLHRQLADLHGTAAALDSLGFAHHGLGNHAEAVTSFGSALELFVRLGDRYKQADTLTRLADVHHAADDAAAERDCRRRAQEILDLLDLPC
jgi:tetratricopeptide (TPR) repeat protein